VDEALELVLQEPYATAVFRIVQESLTNVAKHAGASQVGVSLGQVPGGVRLLVQDNGCGFSAIAQRKPQSMGLMGLRERAQLLGGSASIQSVPGQGTCVEVFIPLGHSAKGVKK
jgi:signal transduction histidine kinase